MRLIRTGTFELEEFVEDGVPPYAILSHRWSPEELTFKEVAKGRIDTKKSGYFKLLGACQAAEDNGVEFVWIDTCCIDKRSSAELSEAINSMFAWYEQARVCLAYLEDVASEPALGRNIETAFQRSVWFTRSWTLQELLAPQRVVFYNSAWELIGDKASNAGLIEQTTGIPREVLVDREAHPLAEYSIAERMSWASRRCATRTEDLAYSLMGIFGINLPLLYGEGLKAFLRLQEELIRSTNDMSFLLWGDFDGSQEGRDWLLARSPAGFKGSGGKIVHSGHYPNPLNITNVGLEIQAAVVRYDFYHYGVILSEGFLKSNDSHILLIRQSHYRDVYYPVGIRTIAGVGDMWFEYRKILISWNGKTAGHDSAVFNGFSIESSNTYPITSVEIESDTNQSRRQFEESTIRNRSSLKIEFQNPQEPATAKLVCGRSSGPRLLVDLAYDFDGRPCALIGKHRSNTRLWKLSDHIEQSNRPANRPQEYMVIDVPDGEAKVDAAFFRCTPRDGRCTARVPTRLAGDRSQLWVQFIAPLSSYNNSPFWKFRMEEGNYPWY